MTLLGGAGQLSPWWPNDGNYGITSPGADVVTAAETLTADAPGPDSLSTAQWDTIASIFGVAAGTGGILWAAIVDLTSTPEELAESGVGASLVVGFGGLAFVGSLIYHFEGGPPWMLGLSMIFFALMVLSFFIGSDEVIDEAVGPDYAGALLGTGSLILLYT
jgi:hypothetical protein